MISIRLTGESGHCQRRRISDERRDRGEHQQRQQRERRAALGGRAGVAVALPARGHRELLGGEDVVGRVEAVRVRRQALVAGADAELVGGQHVVRLLDAARIAGIASPGISVRSSSLSLPHLWTRAHRFELEAAAFRRLVEHLRERTDVQNIDLMELAGFCRNCLSRWYREAAEERGVELTDPQAREIVYGMPYEEWKSRHQT